MDRYAPSVPHILLAADADWIVDEVTAALGDAETSFTVVSEGRVVHKVVREKAPDLAVLDLQVGSMGGMAITMDLHHDESAGAHGHVPVLMLLDRVADVHLAKRSGAEGWIIKPLDALRLSRAAEAILGGGTYTEGLPQPLTEPEAQEVAEDAPAAEEEPAPAG